MAWCSGKLNEEGFKTINKYLSFSLDWRESPAQPGAVAKKGEEGDHESSEQPSPSKQESPVKEEQIENDSSKDIASEQVTFLGEAFQEAELAGINTRSTEEMQDNNREPRINATGGDNKTNLVKPVIPLERSEHEHAQVDENASSIPPKGDASGLTEKIYANREKDAEEVKEAFPVQDLDAASASHYTQTTEDAEDAKDNFRDCLPGVLHNKVAESDFVAHQFDTPEPIGPKKHSGEQYPVPVTNSFHLNEPLCELDKVKGDLKIMETALQGAARQAQAKADEISKLMNENEQLKTIVDDLKINEDEIESLREEYHQRVAVLERKVYALTKERDTLRREQNKKSDIAAVLREKDEIISELMAEGEELSKKQATQESQIRKLRSQIREIEQEKKGLLTKIQVEENRVDSLKRDKAATEKLLQETIEKHQAELANQKEYYTNAVNAAKEAKILAEERATAAARTELESRLKVAEDRESMLVRTLEELRQTLSRSEQQAIFKEDTLRRDIEDLQKQYQVSEHRCKELISQVPDSTRSLLRQIEAMQENAARSADAWSAAERSLNARLQEAEAKASTAEEKERSINERLTQTRSRINVLESQVSYLRAELTQQARSLEKERQKAAEHRQEYLVLKVEADTYKGHVNQLEKEIQQLKRNHKEELLVARRQHELTQQDVEQDKAGRMSQERVGWLHTPGIPRQSPLMRQEPTTYENGLIRNLSSTSSLSSMEESYILQTTLEPSEDWSTRSVGEGTLNPYYVKSMTSSTFEAALRQKDGEIASYVSRLASLESIRDSLAEELVDLTAQCEKLLAETAAIPILRAELDTLKQRHLAALELMGERDEELEELRADVMDMKDMYKEQVNLLVSRIQILGSSTGAA